eukprot:3566473-Prymnesium_polylepis.6
MVESPAWRRSLVGLARVLSDIEQPTSFALATAMMVGAPEVDRPAALGRCDVCARIGAPAGGRHAEQELEVAQSQRLAPRGRVDVVQQLAACRVRWRSRPEGETSPELSAVKRRGRDGRQGRASEPRKRWKEIGRRATVKEAGRTHAALPQLRLAAAQRPIRHGGPAQVPERRSVIGGEEQQRAFPEARAIEGLADVRHALIQCANHSSVLPAAGARDMGLRLDVALRHLQLIIGGMLAIGWHAQRDEARRRAMDRLERQVEEERRRRLCGPVRRRVVLDNVHRRRREELRAVPVGGAPPTRRRVVPVVDVARVIAEHRVESAPLGRVARLVEAQVPLADEVRAVADSSKHLRQHRLIDGHCFRRRVSDHTMLQAELHWVTAGEERGPGRRAQRLDVVVV